MTTTHPGKQPALLRVRVGVCTQNGALGRVVSLRTHLRSRSDSLPAGTPNPPPTQTHQQYQVQVHVHRPDAGSGSSANTDYKSGTGNDNDTPRSETHETPSACRLDEIERNSAIRTEGAYKRFLRVRVHYCTQRRLTLTASSSFVEFGHITPICY